jgi:hypothetical protein
MARPLLSDLALAESPEAWERLGFAVRDGRSRVGSITIHLTGGDGGIAGWTLEGGPGESIDGLPALPGGESDARAPDAHANGAVAIDHVVVLTPDAERTCGALGAGGLDVRRMQDAQHGERKLRRGFVLAANVLVEVVGPREPEGPGPASFWGLTVSVADLDAVARMLGDSLGAVRDAVQPGRRIATVQRSAGLRTPVAFITPR